MTDVQLVQIPFLTYQDVHVVLGRKESIKGIENLLNN